MAKIGGGDLTFGPVIGHEIIGITPHPRFDRGTMSNDLAILKLKEPVTNTPLALALAEDSALYTEGTSATVLGYGAADSTLPILPFVLQEAAIPMVSDQTCMNEIGRYFNPETQVCAGVKASSATAGDGVDSCFGDSGGPLVVSDGTGHYKQVGVVSWGLGGCAGNKTRGIYSKVIANEDFVISFPMAKPMADDLPRIQLPESLSAGSEVRCVTPTLYGDTPAELTYPMVSVLTDGTSSDRRPRRHLHREGR